MTDWRISFGSEVYLKELRNSASRRSGTTWTMVKVAVPGDRVAFYFKRPHSSFVAVGTVASLPQKQLNKQKKWYGKYMSRVNNISMIDENITLYEMKRIFPAWGWTSYPRNQTTVPEEFRRRFAGLVGGAAPVRSKDAIIAPPITSSDIEGMMKEATHFSRGRSRRLRDQAMSQANGVCRVCRQDYSRVLGGNGQRVLQVHHCKPLSGAKLPRRTHLKDLAVVCANCHLLIHLNPKRPFKIEALHKRLKADQGR